MGIGRGMWEFRTAGLLFIALSSVFVTPAATVRSARTATKEAKAVSGYGQLPLSFEENRGQTDSGVRYLSRGGGYTLFLTNRDAVLSLSNVDANRQSLSTTIRMRFAGSSAQPGVNGSEPQPGRSNYLSGSDSSKWQTGIRHFGRVTYEGIYPGVDAVYYGNQRQLEYDLILAPGADAKQIRLEFDGLSGMRIDRAGNLLLKTALGDLQQVRPVVYQMIDGRRNTVAARYTIHGDQVGFEIARYDRRKPLVIDPVLQWSTFLGGSGLDVANGIAVDSNNSAYVVGYTASADFLEASRVLGVLRSGATDAFILKYAVNGASLLYSTFIAGSGNDQALGVAVDLTGAAYICGLTDSIDFPLVTPNQNQFNGAQDGFVLKLRPAGDALAFSSYVGGFGTDVVNDIKLDADNNVVFAGSTNSTNIFPTGFYSGGLSDAFAAKLNATGIGYVWTRMLGSTKADYANAVAVDSTGAVYVTGRTNGFSFPVTSGVMQGSIAVVDAYDAFVTKIGTGGALEYSTFLGGSAYDEGASIGVDATFNAYVFGVTDSGNFPTTAPVQVGNAGNRDAFLTKINPTGTARVYSTYLGGSGTESAGRMAVNATTGTAYLTGATNSTNFPNVNAVQLVNNGLNDVFIVEMNAAGSALTSSTYVGGASDDVGKAIAIDASNNLYVAGSTTSFNFPVLTPAQATLLGTQDGFVMKLSNCSTALTPLLGAIPGRAHSASAESGSIVVTAAADCNYAAVASDTWILITGTGTGTGTGAITYTVGVNTGAARTGFISVGGQKFTLTQAAAPVPGGGCVYPIPQAAIFAGGGGTGTFVVGTSTPGCTFTVTSNVPWIQVFPTGGTNTATVSYTVYPNFGTNARSGTITVNNLAPLVVSQSSAALTEPQRFVTLAYFSFFGRYPSQGEIDFQANALAGGLSRADLIFNFFNSIEFNAGGRFVSGLYVGLLNRNAEFGGWLFQRNALARGGATPDGLVSNFINSAEYMLKNPNQTPEQFVTLLYIQVLGRTPSQDEVNFQAAALNAGLSRVALATSFLNAPEFRLGTDARLNAFLLYATLLSRDASVPELQNRMIQLGAGTPLQSIIADFLGSVEFQGRLL
jgi:hypothetical protein